MIGTETNRYLFNLFCNAQCRWKIQKIGGAINTYEYVSHMQKHACHPRQFHGTLICILADQLTLAQPGGADYSQHIIK